MYWLFGLVIGVVVLVLLVLTVINFKRYAWLIILLVLVLIGALSLLYWSDQSDGARTPEFSDNDLSLTNASLVPSHGSFYRFAVEVDNLSSSRQLAAIEVLIELLDCKDLATSGSCEVTESQQKLIKMRLLAASNKRVEAYVSFKDIAVERSPEQWRYELVRGIAQ